MKQLPITQQPRCCWSCKHICYISAAGGYSEMTPGSDFYLSCNEGHWTFDNYKDGLDDFRTKLETAETCQDFEDRLR